MAEEHLARLRAALREEGWDAFLVTQPENRRYLSGFTGSAGFLLIAPQRQWLCTDSRYVEQAVAQAAGFEVEKVEGNAAKFLAHLLLEHRARTVAFESHHVTVAELHRWQETAPHIEWIPTENIVERLRLCKGPEEVKAIRQAVKLADEAFAQVSRILRPGLTERGAAWELEAQMRKRGAERVAFDLIVGSGPNGAMPHAVISQRRIHAGEPVVIDIGAVFDGYHSDMTRTVSLREADGRYLEIYKIVLEAQREAEAALKPGMTGAEVDQIARQVIEQAGYGDHFGHGLGHGVGLSVHEGPRLSQASQDMLQPGMVVTIEPGIYLPGWGGVRLEDLVVVTAEGCEVLTQSPKEPIIGRARKKAPS